MATQMLLRGRVVERKKFHFVIWLKPFFLLPSDHWLKPVAIEEKKRSTLLF
jgi:hypothetical protein